MKEIQGNLYVGNLKESIAHYTKKYGTQPAFIYCNKDEFLETTLMRIVDRLPRGNYILTHIVKEK
jgi:hypothetical protein